MTADAPADDPADRAGAGSVEYPMGHVGADLPLRSDRLPDVR